MGTYIKMYHSKQCNNIYCNGGYDRHPNLNNLIIDSLYNRINIKECCKWSLYDKFDLMNLEINNNREICIFYDNCYRMNINHLINYEHKYDK
jgi:hypothetical protein